MSDDTGLVRPSLRSGEFLIQLDLVGSDGEAIHQVQLSCDAIGGGMMMVDNHMHMMVYIM